MSPNGKLWTAVIAAGVVGALVGAGALWAMNNNKAPETASTDSAQLAIVRAELEKKDAEIKALTEKLDSFSTSDTAAPSDASTATVVVSTAKQFTFVTAVATGSKPTVTADYAQFLTGKAAADAATAHGDESPPPNDYYIANDNKKLRTLPVKPGITVKLTARDDGTSDPEGYSVPFATWAGYYATPKDDTRSITAGPYWFTINSGVVTKIEQQYTP